MAIPVANTMPLTGNPLVDGLVQGSSWQFGSAPHQLSYSFSLNDNPNGGPWTPALADGVRQALAAWSNIANIGFVEAGSGTVFTQSPADLAVTLTGTDLQMSLDAISLGFFPDPSFAKSFLDASGATRADYRQPEGDVFLDNGFYLFSNVAPGTWGYTVIIHELGHALGLKHPYDDGANSRPTFSELGITQYERTYYTLMATPGSEVSMNGGPATPMVLDILAMQSIYGANMAYHTGDDTYTARSYPYTIWDAGGNDTLDYSTSPVTGATVDLRPGITPNAVQPNTVTIAYGVTIENAVGTRGADTITGNDAANVIDGGAGADRMSGGRGDDTYVVDIGPIYYQHDEVIEMPGEGEDTVRYGASVGYYDLPDSVENLVQLGTSGVALRGNASNNVITTNAVFLGANAIYGGRGDDTYVLATSADVVYEYAGEGSDTIVAGFTCTLPTYVENLTLTGTANLDGTGNAFDNVLTGNSGVNVLTGGAGNDTYYIQTMTDVVRENANEGSDTVAVPYTYTLSIENIENLTLSGNSPIDGTGTESANVLTGNGAANVLRGVGGDDSLFGRGGMDTLAGMTGNDALNGGSGQMDFAQYGGSRTNYSIVNDGWTTTISSADSGTDTLQSVEHARFSDMTIDLGASGMRHFNATGDGTADVLWQNDNGTIALWQVNGPALVGGGNLGTSSSEWTLVEASGDYNGDGRSDILWRHDSGAMGVWQLNGASIGSGGNIGMTSAQWHVQAAAGDYNNDGRSDVLWRNDDGTIAVWTMNGLNIAGGGNAGRTGSNWQIVEATADYSGDSTSDILWRSDEGTIGMWNMSGATVIGGGNVGVTTSAWHIVDARGDYNGDHKADVLWRSDSGDVAIWELNGPAILAGGNVATTTPAWDIVDATGDYNGDGRSDVLFVNADGTVGVWLMNGVAIGGGGNVGVAAPGWNMMNGTLDYNGDGKSDVLWHNDNGDVAVWLMDGAHIAGGGNIAHSASDWMLVA